MRTHGGEANRERSREQREMENDHYCYLRDGGTRGPYTWTVYALQGVL